MRKMVFLLAACAVSLACQGEIAPMSAQAGSTVLIPVDGSALGSPNALQGFGYGGTEQSDPQRGTLIYSLRGTSPVVELTTLASGATQAHPSTDSFPFGGTQVVSLVTIPATADPGTYDLDVVRRLPGGTEYALEYHAQLTVLPNVVDMNDGTFHTASPTGIRFRTWGSPSWTPVSATNLAAFTPDPEIRILLSQPVHALEVDLLYPAGTIDVLDAYGTRAVAITAAHPPIVWHTDDANGTAHVSAAANRESFRIVSVTFDLDDPAVRLADNLPGVSVSALTAYDANGNQISVQATLEGF